MSSKVDISLNAELKNIKRILGLKNTRQSLFTEESQITEETRRMSTSWNTTKDISIELLEIQSKHETFPSFLTVEIGRKSMICCLHGS